MDEKRTCGECGVCCVTAGVDEGDFHKLPGTPCPLLSACGSKRCTVFGKNERPKMCSTFQCAWLRGYCNEAARPDKSHLMVSVNNFGHGSWIFALETKHGALWTTGKKIIADIAGKIDLPVIIVDANSKYPNDLGDYVAIKDSLEKRSKAIKGTFLGALTDKIKVYKLINGKEK